MANIKLKDALDAAGLTAEELAEIVRVDPKTVQRWLAGTSTPYRRHQATIARALDLPSNELWPDQLSGTPSAPATGDDLEGVSATEVIGSWAYETDEQAPDPVALIAATTGPVDLLDSGRGLEITGDLVDAIDTHATRSTPVRLLTSWPPQRLRPLVGHARVEIRVIDGWSQYALLRIDDMILLSFPLAAEGDEPPSLMHLRRRTQGGLFDRLAENFETLWNDAEETLTSLEQLDAYRTNTDHDDDAADAADAAAQLAGPGDPVNASAPIEPEEHARRWPRRPT